MIDLKYYIDFGVQMQELGKKYSDYTITCTVHVHYSSLLKFKRNIRN